jgi:hypothetical protein
MTETVDQAQAQPPRAPGRRHRGRHFALLLVRPGESGGRYVCELLASLPDSSA